MSKSSKNNRQGTMRVKRNTKTPRRPSKSKKTKVQKKRTRGGWALWGLKWAFVFGVALSAVAAASLAFLFWWWGRDAHLPDFDSLDAFRPKQVSRVLSSDGKLVAEIYEQRRTWVEYEKIPPLVVNGFKAAEDKDFDTHSGIDVRGIFRAAFANLRAGKKTQGASTITQQVVKNFLLTNERTVKRKIQEIILARRLEKKFSKSQIMELYLNQIFFGANRYGVKEAARFYFDKKLDELDAGEVAVLAGLPKAPSRLAPTSEKNIKRTKTRQTYVLNRMAEEKYISREEADAFIAAPIPVVTPKDQGREAVEWLEIGQKHLESLYPDKPKGEWGATLTTTVDSRMQQLAKNALQEGLRELDEANKIGRRKRRVKSSQVSLERARFGKKRRGEPEVGKAYDALVIDVDSECVVDLGKWTATLDLDDGRFNPEQKKASELFAVGDIVRVKIPAEQAELAPEKSPRWVTFPDGAEGAIVVMDIESREIRALVGGFDVKPAGFNRATMAKRQAGSTFKPFVYAAAIETREYTPATVVNDAPEVYEDVDEMWKPQNYQKDTYNGPVLLRWALAKSINTVAIRVASAIGIGRVVDMAHQLGIQSKLPSTLALALGAGEVSLLELTNAFAAFADGGAVAEPRFILSVNGEEVPGGPKSQGIPADLAFVVLDMMKSVVNYGTGAKAGRLNIPLAGKTGTSNGGRDAWFVGLTPKYAIGVWVGKDDFTPIGKKGSGSGAALPIFVKLAGKMKLPALEFQRPEGVVQVAIDSKSGLLAHPTALPEETLQEVFLVGTEPKETALGADEVSPADLTMGEYADDPAPQAPLDPAP